MPSILDRLWSETVSDPILLDHVPVSAERSDLQSKLMDAAKRFGRPFKCAADGIPHEVLPSKSRRTDNVLRMKGAKS